MMENDLNRVETSVKSTVRDVINRMEYIPPDDRFSILEEMGEWIFCEYDELEIDWLEYHQYTEVDNESKS